MNESLGAPKAASGRQIAKGIAFMSLFKFADRGIGLLSTLVLARLLTPGDFGLVAMGSSLVALTELMSSFGFDSALIQRQDARRKHYDTAWTFNVIFGIAVSLLLILLAKPAAVFYHEPRLELIVPWLALGALISGFENIGTVAFRKELNFHKEFRFLLFKRVSGFLVTIALAVTFRSFWALIAGIITAKSVAVVISYLLHPYRPKFSLAARSDLFNFSKWLFISNLINFFRSRSTDFILGRTVGTHGLGIFNIASEIAMMPATELVAPMNRAVYPAYSRLASNPDELGRRFMQVFGMIGLITFPASFGLVSIADLSVKVLLGSQWLEAIPIVRLVAVCGLASALQSNMHVYILAVGKPKVSTYFSGILLLISLPIIIYCSLLYGTVGAAAAYLVSSLFALLGTFYIFSKLSKIKFLTIVGTLLRPCFGSAIMAIAVFIANNWIASNMPDFSIVATMLTLILLGGISYTAIVLVLWLICKRPSGPEQMMLTAIQSKLPSR